MKSIFIGLNIEFPKLSWFLSLEKHRKLVSAGYLWKSQNLVQIKKIFLFNTFMEQQEMPEEKAMLNFYISLLYQQENKLFRSTFDARAHGKTRPNN